MASNSGETKLERNLEDPPIKISCSRTLGFSSPSSDPKAGIFKILSPINLLFFLILETGYFPERKSREIESSLEKQQWWKEEELVKRLNLNLVGEVKFGKWVKQFTVDMEV